MRILKELSEFFNLIEPWLVFFVFIFQIVFFFLIKKKEMEKSQVWNDIKLQFLKWLNLKMKEKDSQKQIPDKPAQTKKKTHANKSAERHENNA